MGLEEAEATKVNGLENKILTLEHNIVRLKHMGKSIEIFQFNILKKEKKNRRKKCSFFFFFVREKGKL